MSPRSLRVGTRLPNPGAVMRGCPRPKALRFDSPLPSLHGGWTVFGDGVYSNNIKQHGVVLRPQYYMLDGIIPMPRCIVVTGNATVDPDPSTGAAAFTCYNLVLIGSAATLSASSNCKGLLGFVSNHVVSRGGAHLYMDKLGKAGAFGDLSPDMLLPTELAGHVATNKLKKYVVKGRGADGGAPQQNGGTNGSAGNSGYPAGPMQTGGGGSGEPTGGWTGPGGCGGPCCGGAGSGASVFANSAGAGDYGGPGSSGAASNNYAVGGGAGDPPGDGAAGGLPGDGPGGGLLVLCARGIDIGNAGIVSSDGANGGLPRYGGCAGGGCIIIITLPGAYHNHGTVRAMGGFVGSGSLWGGPGGLGSVNIFEFNE